MTARTLLSARGITKTYTMGEIQVHALRESEFEATLVNQPIGIKALREGQRGTWSLEGLSDWAIFGTRGQFDPSSIFFLERQLAEEQDGA